jgi:predicted ATPase/DNA-binding winged helix-turn-helix (wHTH) protein
MLAQQYHSIPEPTAAPCSIPPGMLPLPEVSSATETAGARLTNESSSKSFDERSVITFGEFKLHPTKQLLLRANEPVQIGGRAFDILLALVERAGQLVAKEELIARAWPNTFVDQASVRVHMAALRRALGDDQTGNRYVATIPGRGYRFVVPVSYRVETDGASIVQALGTFTAHGMIGRRNFVANLLAQLEKRRLITIIGSGGVGKSTVALAVAKLRSSLNQTTCYIDFAQLADPTLVMSTLATSLEIPFFQQRSISSLVSWLRQRPILLIFDNCEHLATPIAALAEQLLDSAPNIQILATSREPLRTCGESLMRLQPLGVPRSAAGLHVADALNYPAVQLFVRCAAANSESFEFNDASAHLVADICQRVDGVALAVELAAQRIEALGLRRLAAVLGDQLDILSQGRRTALARHQSLRANFEWSYELVPEHERRVLCLLANLTGDFTLDSAVTMLAQRNFDPSLAIEAIANLVAKSLIWAEEQENEVSYRLPLATRSYALEKSSGQRSG